MGYFPYMNYNGLLEEAVRAAGVAVLAFLGVYLLVAAISVLSYILGALGLYTIAQRREIRHPWLAWIPFGNLWILGSIADQYQYVTRGRVKSRRKVLLGLQIAMSALGLCILGVYVYAIAQMLASSGDITKILGEILTPLGMIVALICAGIYVLGIVAAVIRFVCLYELFASCEPNSKVGFLLLSIFLGVTEPFLVFACRKKDYGMPPRKDAYTCQEPVYSEG